MEICSKFIWKLWKNGCLLNINPLASNELLITLYADTDELIKDTVNTWQEAAEWVNDKITYYYGVKDKTQPKYNYDDDDEDDEENETLYDLVAVYDKNKKFYFIKNLKLVKKNRIYYNLMKLKKLYLLQKIIQLLK